MKVIRCPGAGAAAIFSVTRSRSCFARLLSSTDVLLIGKLLGDHALGVYSVAFQLATLPVSKVFGIVNRVAFPAYARLQHDNRQAAEYFIASVKLTWFAFCPILWGLDARRGLAAAHR